MRSGISEGGDQRNVKRLRKSDSDHDSHGADEDTLKEGKIDLSDVK